MGDMKSRRSVARGIAVLIVGFLAAGAFAIGPATAGKFLTKKKALKLFYTKGAADERFINVGEQASDADKLDGISSANILPGGTLPQGRMLRGTFHMGDTADAAGDLADSEISFGFNFSAPPTHHFIESGDPVPAGCSGSHSNPSASPGHLCVFEMSAMNRATMDNFNITGPSGDGSTYSFGARLWVRSAGTGDFWSQGTWAATPAGSSTRAPTGGSGEIAGT